MGSQVAASEVSVPLLDGRIAVLRPLGAGDADVVRRFHQQLGDQDRYFRFFTHHPAHLDELVHSLTEPGDRKTAVAAFDNGRLIAVANFVIGEDPSVADVAIVVAHDDHLRGVGTALFKHLARLARCQGVRRFVADILAENQLMLQVLADSGWPHRRSGNGSVYHVEIELPDVT